MTTSLRVFLGSYADAEGPGVYACAFDETTGALTLIDEVSGLQNPTFLDIDAKRRILYALTEQPDEQGGRAGAAVAMEIAPDSGRLTPLGRESTVPAPTCHIALDRERRALLTSSYHGGLVGLSPLLPDGRVAPCADMHRHEGTSVLPVQSQARVHSVFMDQANRYAIVCDLGLDRVFVYRLDLDAMQLQPHGEAAVAPGSGPRHFAFHPTLPYGYVINELNATITAFRYDEALGALEAIGTFPTLPDGYDGDNACADIHISPDGRFLYGSNRGHDSIAVYAIDSDSGMLTLVQHAPTLGGHPRNFALSPDGRYLLVANRDGNHVVTFARDAESGKLTPTGHELQVSKPVCVKFAYI
ncbi:lactonase family protein [Paenibacillus sp. IB182496]|uniref:Lactonase family protein n=1 Tax=Paenibacillus sabuli TaxID=2772509 RepID=A0A927BT85_9BACL|nr:lactonase family protein [Paenibacillus sabuli]MBD2845003.1 lactonase family protein [Paenibacillus sabuli]